jgi:lysophospholipase L1-like esterase
MGSLRRSLALQSGVRAMLCWAAAVIAYNAHKQYVNHTSAVRFPSELRDEIVALMPWAAGIAFVVTLAVGLVTHPRGEALGAMRSAASLALIALSINLLGLAVAPAVLPTYNAALLCFVLLVSVLAFLERALRPAAVSLRRGFARLGDTAGSLGGLVAVCGALLVAAAWFWAEVWTGPYDTLHEIGAWRSEKVGPERAVPLARGVMGAISFLTTRPALYRSRLNLGAWHGYQELWYDTPVEPGSVSFDFLLPEDGYVVFLFNSRGGAYSGVRLSRHAELGSACLEVREDRSFAARARIDTEFGPGWSRFRMEPRDGLYAVSVDGVALGQCGSATPGPQQIGFRGSLRDAWVDAVEIEAHGDGPVLREDFENRRGFIGNFLAALLTGLALNGAVVWVAHRRLDRGLEPRLFVVFATSLTLAITGAAGWAVDALNVARLYPTDAPVYDYPVSFEDEETIRERLQRVYGASSDAHRILFIGGSQTWGSGARELGEIFSAQLETWLRERGRRVECINAGISALGSSDLVARYEQEWIHFDPSLVVINASNNDADPEVFADNLRRFVSLSRARGARTIFVLEANSIEGPQENIGPNHAAMRLVASELGVSVVDMHEHFARIHDEGFLWWDVVHLTSYGQLRLAQKLFEVILPLVPRDSGSGPIPAESGGATSGRHGGAIPTGTSERQ